jgi:hypothetical protein
MRSKAYILQNICIVDSMKLYNIQYALSRGGGGEFLPSGARPPALVTRLITCLDFVTRVKTQQDVFTLFVKSLERSCYHLVTRLMKLVATCYKKPVLVLVGTTCSKSVTVIIFQCGGAGYSTQRSSLQNKNIHICLL